MYTMKSKTAGTREADSRAARDEKEDAGSPFPAPISGRDREIDLSKRKKGRGISEEEGKLRAIARVCPRTLGGSSDASSLVRVHDLSSSLFTGQGAGAAFAFWPLDNPRFLIFCFVTLLLRVQRRRGTKIRACDSMFVSFREPRRGDRIRVWFPRFSSITSVVKSTQSSQPSSPLSRNSAGTGAENTDRLDSDISDRLSSSIASGSEEEPLGLTQPVFASRNTLRPHSWKKVAFSRCTDDGAVSASASAVIVYAIDSGDALGEFFRADILFQYPGIAPSLEVSQRLEKSLSDTDPESVNKLLPNGLPSRITCYRGQVSVWTGEFQDVKTINYSDRQRESPALLNIIIASPCPLTPWLHFNRCRDAGRRSIPDRVRAR
ncbi:hypothetical protein HPB48_002727 [Haemaphysalis longicornis]|uniref:Uncharacterized protein n=1 Tax=Haemaphysalis longicornis TaxID=44386 RepID=A0A9J6GEV3_HAELO|nr:hypothetical protein HPB48_002727 [Haemaphysalis longicornis]